MKSLNDLALVAIANESFARDAQRQVIYLTGKPSDFDWQLGGDPHCPLCGEAMEAEYNLHPSSDETSIFDATAECECGTALSGICETHAGADASTGVWDDSVYVTLPASALPTH